MTADLAGRLLNVLGNLQLAASVEQIIFEVRTNIAVVAPQHLCVGSKTHLPLSNARQSVPRPNVYVLTLSGRRSIVADGLKRLPGTFQPQLMGRSARNSLRLRPANATCVR